MISKSGFVPLFEAFEKVINFLEIGEKVKIKNLPKGQEPNFSSLRAEK